MSKPVFGKNKQIKNIKKKKKKKKKDKNKILSAVNFTQCFYDVIP